MNRLVSLGIGILAVILTIFPAHASTETPSCFGTAPLPRNGTWIERSPPCALPLDTPFQNAAGDRLTLADFAGKVVLVNLWATWCPPCIREMPSLDRLHQALGGEEFEVVAISNDLGSTDRPRQWLARSGLRALAFYADPRGATMQTLQAPGLPTSLLLDRDGRELARLTGATEWDSPRMITRIRALGGLGAP